MLKCADGLFTAPPFDVREAEVHVGVREVAIGLQSRLVLRNCVIVRACKAQDPSSRGVDDERQGIERLRSGGSPPAPLWSDPLRTGLIRVHVVGAMRHETAALGVGRPGTSAPARLSAIESWTAKMSVSCWSNRPPHSDAPSFVLTSCADTRTQSPDRIRVPPTMWWRVSTRCSRTDIRTSGT